MINLKAICSVVLFSLFTGCAYVGSHYEYVEQNGLSMVDDNQFVYKDMSSQSDFFTSGSIVVLMRRREDVFSNFYFLLWKDGHCYWSSAMPIDGSVKDLCTDTYGYKGFYFISGDTLYTEIITGDMEHLFRNYIIHGDTFQYVSFSKQPRFRNQAIEQKLYPEDIRNGSMVRIYTDSTICEKLKHSFW